MSWLGGTLPRSGKLFEELTGEEQVLVNKECLQLKSDCVEVLERFGRPHNNRFRRVLGNIALLGFFERMVFGIPYNHPAILSEGEKIRYRRCGIKIDIGTKEPIKVRITSYGLGSPKEARDVDIGIQSDGLMSSGGSFLRLHEGTGYLMHYVITNARGLVCESVIRRANWEDVMRWKEIMEKVKGQVDNQDLKQE